MSGLTGGIHVSVSGAVYSVSVPVWNKSSFIIATISQIITERPFQSSIKHQLSKNRYDGHSYRHVL